jgi:N utilization substance protein B
MGSRRRARELALQILFQLDAQEDLTVAQAMALFFHHLAIGEADADSGAATAAAATSAAEGLDTETRDFCEALVRGVREHLDELDRTLGQASRNWRLERMARVDRNLLRLALYELRHMPDVPAKVAINEAIEIAKRFGTADSPAFVNGILDRCLEEKRGGGGRRGGGGEGAG